MLNVTGAPGQAAERVITQDLEYMIGKAVDTSKADYIVVTGVQVGPCKGGRCQRQTDRSTGRGTAETEAATEE